MTKPWEQHKSEEEAEDLTRKNNKKQTCIYTEGN